VVPFAAGGGTDVVARPIALAMGDVMGQPVAYDNRGGGNGMIAGEIVARAAPDGYTLLVGSPSIMTTNQHLYAKMPFDPLKDFVPIVKFANVPNLLIANPALPARTVQELIDYAKANPGKLNWASSGIGAGGHLALELVQIKAGIKGRARRLQGRGAGADRGDRRRRATAVRRAGRLHAASEGRPRARARHRQHATHCLSCLRCLRSTNPACPGWKPDRGTGSLRPPARPPQSSGSLTQQR
jgi:hypothetical protein